MRQEPIIIIGGGLAGLAAGCYARINGYEARIFEHHSSVGGVVAAWRRGDYLIDGGVHFLMGCNPGQSIYTLYEDLGIAPSVRTVDPSLYGVLEEEATGRRFTATPDMERLSSDMKTISPADAPVIDEFMAGVRAMRGADMEEMGMSKPPELTGTLDKLRQAWEMRGVFRYYGGKFSLTAAEFGQKHLRDPWLRWIFENTFLPEVPVWFLMMLFALIADRQIGLLEDGSPGLVNPLEARFLKLGGEITCDATVEEILVEDDRACGVRLADGSVRRAGRIVSAADGTGTLFKMLKGRYVPDDLKEKYRTWKRIYPFVCASFGVSRAFEGEPWMRMIRLREPITAGNACGDTLSIRLFNYSPRFAPPGKTVLQASFLTGWDFWNDLRQKDSAAYDAEKERAAAQILDRLAVHYPGLPSRVEVTDVFTPYTTWRYTLNDRGAFEGWLPTPETITTPLPRTLPGLKNFYMAGQWVMPGGGAPPCLYSGRHAAQIICYEDGKAFRNR
ncbi:MAG: NAD(P)/FAD-dependent oxidoreductase [Armatimonadetes bacterium]|nr:NAD(P)/FAD-dependent oxidoreductase [Armatimonadota bacterium]